MRLVSGRLLREFRLTRRKREPSTIGRVLMMALCASRRISPPNPRVVFVPESNLPSYSVPFRLLFECDLNRATRSCRAFQPSEANILAMDYPEVIPSALAV